MKLSRSTRRIHERKFRTLEVTLITQRGEEFVGQTRDISLGGMFIITGAPLAQTGELALKFTLPALGEYVLAQAVVRWVDDAGAGVQFRSLHAMEAWALHQFMKPSVS